MLQEAQTHEQESEAENEFSNTLSLLIAAEEQWYADGNEWEGKGGNVLLLKPTNDIIHAVTVVPTLAPMMTPMDWRRVIRPAFTKLTTMTVVALDD